MKLKLWGLLGLSLVLLSCEKEPLAVDSAALQAQLVDENLVHTMFVKGPHWNAISFEKKAFKKHQVTKKLKIRSSGTMVMTPESPECGGNIQVSVAGEGNATHLGLFTVSIQYCTDGENPLGPILATQVAANGDELYSVVVGADPAVGSLDYMYYGGTGRFEDASGFITLFFNFDYVNGTFSNYGEGTITY